MKTANPVKPAANPVKSAVNPVQPPANLAKPSVTPSQLSAQLSDEKRRVDFDSFDFSVKQLVSMFSEGIIDIAPAYQRQFRWLAPRQSQFIESVLLGIPIPSLFMAANPDGRWEVIDGVQRLSSLVHFSGEVKDLKKIGVAEHLTLCELEKLALFNGHTYATLPDSIKLQFQLKPLRVTTVSDKSDFKVRFDLFERLNTGGVSLTDQEIRACIFTGPFNEFLHELSGNADFRKIIHLPVGKENDGTRDEYVLRFFAFLNNYKQFDHSVRDFLNEYMRTGGGGLNLTNARIEFEMVFRELAKILKSGIKRRSVTPVNLFEAITVGAALALRKSGALVANGIEHWMISPALKATTSQGTNSQKMVSARIEFCRDRFLGL